jgi:hypothetical protein
MFMFGAERGKLVIRNHETFGIAFAFVQVRLYRAGIILILDFENLETLPSEWIKPLNCRSHVLLPIEAADDRVEFELDAKLATPISNSEQLRYVLAGAATDLNVRLFVEAITADPENINMLAVFREPAFSDLRSVRYD